METRATVVAPPERGSPSCLCSEAGPRARGRVRGDPNYLVVMGSDVFACLEMGRRPEAIGVENADPTSREPLKVTSAPKLHVLGPFSHLAVQVFRILTL